MIKIILFCLLTLCQVYAQEKEGHETGNGGAGVKEDGVYMTFLTAGIYVVPEILEDIPGMRLFEETILDIGGDGSRKILQAGLPSRGRRFYRIVKEKTELGELNHLVGKYAELIQQEVRRISIFAITDIPTKTTYLLPAFYELTEVEQAAILFHEAYWVLNPIATYPQIIEGEMLFQKFIEAKLKDEYDLRFPRLLGQITDDPTLALMAAYKEDMRSQKEPTLISPEGLISIKNLFLEGKGCKLEDRGTSFWSYSTFFRCSLSGSDLLKVRNYSRKYSHSAFLKELSAMLLSGPSYIIRKKSVQYEINLSVFHKKQIKDESKREEFLQKNLNKEIDLRSYSFEDPIDYTSELLVYEMYIKLLK